MEGMTLCGFYLQLQYGKCVERQHYFVGAWQTPRYRGTCSIKKHWLSNDTDIKNPPGRGFSPRQQKIKKLLPPVEPGQRRGAACRFKT